MAMTGYRSTYLRHDCRTVGCYIDGLPCWDELIEQFPRKVRPTDVDGFVELGGRFLFIEEKRAGVGPDEGQRRALRLLANLPPVTVLFMRPSDTARDVEALVYDGSEPRGWQPMTTSGLHAWLRTWALAADRGLAWP